jgi:catechol 2,3-dioxygenase-like lactoylglutathione lyase family enzyme
MTPFDKPVLFLATADAERSRAFYERVLGMACVAVEPYALVFRVGDSMLRVQKVDRVPRVPYTVLGWAVGDIRSTVTALSKAGVAFRRYDGLDQDDLGVWHSPSGAMVVWFEDPDGNTLSLTQFR